MYWFHYRMSVTFTCCPTLSYIVIAPLNPSSPDPTSNLWIKRTCMFIPSGLKGWRGGLRLLNIQWLSTICTAPRFSVVEIPLWFFLGTRAGRMQLWSPARRCEQVLEVCWFQCSVLGASCLSVMGHMEFSSLYDFSNAWVSWSYCLNSGASLGVFLSLGLPAPSPGSRGCH